ncbi:AAA family ATPase [Pseudomonas cerasi]
MVSQGFQIVSLTLLGPAVRSAEVRFGKGLNVISGPSDTGKTFILQCIDYLLGGSKVPKSVPEASSYESAELCIIENKSGEEVVLSRSLNSATKFKVVKGSDVFYMGAKHKAGDVNSISNFLLGLSGFQGKHVRVNKEGKVRELSFRDLARLIVVDEESIIKERSPIFTGQYTSATAESSVFRLLLTGVDASFTDNIGGDRLSPLKQSAKIELLQHLLDENAEKIASLNLPTTSWLDVFEENKRIDLIYQDAEESVEAHKLSSSELEAERRSVLENLYKVESKTDVLVELQKRFDLLQQQYMADYGRLQSIAEVSYRLDQLGNVDCPVCGALAVNHNHEHANLELSNEEIAISCRAEMAKIGSLLSDLSETRADNLAQVEASHSELKNLRRDLNSISDVLDEFVKPKIKLVLNAFIDVQVERDLYRRAEELYSREEDLRQMLLEIEKWNTAPAEGMTSPKMGAGEVHEFLCEVETLLEEWHFPNVGRVGFSDREQDIVIGNRERASHGKGVRAITHAAFSLSLLLYCSKNKLPHPGLVIVDSPLVVYREPDTDEIGFSHEVKNSFYRSLALNFKEQQVIVIENDEPPEDLLDLASLIKFTASNSGRGGFIPN